MSKPLIALLTNNDDDVYCFRKELIEGLLAEGYEMLISCPNGPRFELMKDIPYIYSVAVQTSLQRCFLCYVPERYQHAAGFRLWNG